MSHEIVGATLILGLVMTLAVGGGGLARGVAALIAKSTELVHDQGTHEWSIEDASAIVRSIGLEGGKLLLCILVPLFALGLLAAYSQVGFAITPNALGFKPERLDPIAGFGRLFSLKGGVRTLMALLKIGLITTAMGAAAWSQVGSVTKLSSLELGPALAGIGYITIRCVGAGLAVITALSIADYAYQRWQHERDLRMSKQEIRQEMKQSEGDPHVKARIRRLQRELASRRMMQDVPKATVVVTNPTHYAVALSYEREDDSKKGRAPRVVAKGVDHVAQRIKEVAREAGVVVYEDAPLARSIHAQCEIGDQIPVELYQAVAGVLAYVYKLQGRKAAAV